MALIEATIQFKADGAQYLLEFTGDQLVHTMNRVSEAIKDLAKAISTLAKAESTSIEMRSELASIMSIFAAEMDTSSEDETRL